MRWTESYCSTGMPVLRFLAVTRPVIERMTLVGTTWPVRPNIGSLAVYHPGKPIEEVQRELGIKEVIKLASNENPLGPSPRALEVLAGALAGVHFYPDSSGYRLKNALAARYGLTPDYVFLGNGSNEIVQLLSLALLEPGDEVVMPIPSFPRYEPLARLMLAVPREIPLRMYRLDLEAMAKAVNERTKMVYICNPNNPTGTIVTRSQVDTFMRSLPPRVVVVFDEAYFEYVTAGDFPDGLDYVRQGYKAVILRTFSKIYGLAGLRIGYALAAPELVAYLERVREPFNVNTLAQKAAEAALQDVSYIEQVKRLNEEGKNYLYKEFTRLGIPYVPTEANFIFFDTGRDEGEVFRRLLLRGVVVRGGFGYRTWMRVTIGTPAQNQIFIKALEETLKTWAEGC